MTGEYERLQEFGIKARSEGDKVAISFGGTTLRVRNNAEELASAFERLGRSRFGSALEEQLKGLDRQMSRVSAAWGNLTRAIADSALVDKAGGYVAKTLADNLQGAAQILDRANSPGNRNFIDQQDIDSAAADLLKAQQRLQVAQETGVSAFDAAIDPQKAFSEAIRYYSAEVDRLRKVMSDLTDRSKQLETAAGTYRPPPVYRLAEEGASSALTVTDLAQLRGDLDPTAKLRTALRQRYAEIASAYGAGQIDDSEYAKLKQTAAAEFAKPLSDALSAAAIARAHAVATAAEQGINERVQASMRPRHYTAENPPPP